MKLSKTEKRNYVLYILLVLTAVGFYNPLEIFTPIAMKAMFYLVGVSAWYIALKNKLRECKAYPRKDFNLIIVGILTSVIMAQLFQRQSFKLTLIATFPTLLAYMCFPLFMRLGINKKLILKTIGVFILASMVVYLANLAAYPDFVFGQEKEEFDLSRGMVRIKIPYIELFVLMFFYCINKWVNGNRKPVWKWGMTILAVFIVLSVTRQVILLSFLLGGYLLMIHSSWLKRISVLFLGGVFYTLVLPNIPIYKTMLELTERQSEENRLGKEDIRIQAWRFYTYEYQTNKITPVFGNGVPSMGNSPWGKAFEYTTAQNRGGNGCYAADVGWAGFFWYFGAISTWGLLMLFIHAFRKHKSPEERYLTYWIAFICITAVASGPILYYHQIVSIATVLYLIYGKERKRIIGNHRIDHPQLQQL